MASLESYLKSGSETCVDEGHKLLGLSTITNPCLTARLPRTVNGFLLFRQGVGFELFLGVKIVESDCPTGAEPSFTKKIKLNVSHSPCFSAESLIVSWDENYALLSGYDGALLVHLPKNVSTSQNLDDSILCRSERIEESWFSSSSSIQCLKAKFIQNTRTTSSSLNQPYYIALLFSDETIRIYQHDHKSSQRNRRILEISTLSDKSEHETSTRFGYSDPTISFDCGKEVNGRLTLVILRESGQVLMSHLDLESRSPSFESFQPLRMFPQSYDDYGIDSCDVLFISSPVPLIVVATKYGILHHCLLLSDQSYESVDDNESRKKESVLSLYVYESVELELSLSTSDLESGKQTESISSTPIRLFSDDNLIPQQYFCLHSSGIHSVYLEWMHGIMGRNSILNPNTDKTCAQVDYLICTRPKKSKLTSRSVGVLGGVVLEDDESIFCILILEDGTTAFNWIKRMLRTRKISLQTDGEKNEEREERSEFFFIDEVKRILQKSTASPVLKINKDEVSEKEGSELLLRSMQILDTEYIQRLLKAKQYCNARVTAMRGQRDTIIQEIVKLDSRVNGLSTGLQHVRDKTNSAHRKHEKIEKRLRRIENAIQLSVEPGCSSVADSDQMKKLTVLKAAFAAISDRIRMVKDLENGCVEGEKYRISHGFNNEQLLLLKESLTDQQDELEGLKEKVEWARRRVRTD